MPPRTMEPQEDDAIMEDAEEQTDDNNNTSTAFLDSFYGIASADPRERASAGGVLLQHALSNLADASYCFDRLLKGICSGRAAARQGNASCLASFLQRGPLTELRTAGEPTTSDAAFVRRRLLEATDPTQSTRRKGSEERDYQFGRLFGIHAVIRSGILWRQEEEDGVDCMQEFVRDLVRLYRLKRWLREPVIHAICNLLQLLYRQQDNTRALDMARAAVENLVVPELLLKGDMVDHRQENPRSVDNDDSSLAYYSAEQIAMALFLRSQKDVTLPSCALLDTPLEDSTEGSGCFAQWAPSLVETSSVVQPRTHLVWDALWMVLTHSTNTDTKIDVRQHQQQSDLLLPTLWQQVVVDRLLSSSASHERKALALCLLRNVSGVEFVSSLTGRTRLSFHPSILMHIYTPDTIQKLLLDVICAAGGNQRNAHMLKPLAMTTLEQVVLTLVQEDEETTEARWTLARSLLECEPRFDGRTKTKTVETLLGLGEQQEDAATEEQWKKYLSFLESKIVETSAVTTEESNADGNEALNEAAAYKRTGYMDLIFQSTKHLLRVSEADEAKKITPLALTVLQQSLALFAGMAFFDCGSAVKPKEQPPQKKTKKKKKNKQGTNTEDTTTVLDGVILQLTNGPFPYAMRSTGSARFYSLVADRVAAILHSSTTDKETSLLRFMQETQASQDRCVALGAKPIQPSSKMTDDDADEEPAAIVAFLDKCAAKLQQSGQDRMVERKWTESCAVFAHTLQFHLLSCGQAEMGEDDGPDHDDEDEDAEEIASILVGIKELYNIMMKDKKQSEDTDAPNPATLLTEICVNMLSSPIGSNRPSRGAFPTLLREIVKRFWMNGLNLVAQQKGDFDKEAIAIMLHGIGIEMDERMEENDEEDDDSDEDSDIGNEDADEEESVQSEHSSKTGTSKAAQSTTLENDASDEIQIDDEKLQSMMLEDSDVELDEDVLEHNESADTALAKFIQMKQDVRKAGQIARERIVLASQMRCVVLLETFATGKPESWGALLTADVVLHVIAETIQFRQLMARTLEKATGAILGEKRSFVDRITNVLKTKLLKAKVSTCKDRDAVNSPLDFTTKLMGLARSSGERDHQILCGSTILFLVRHVEKPESVLEITDSLLGEAVDEWATKRTSKIDSVLLDTLVHQGPVLSQAVLLPALVKSATVARSSFLKSESHRLIAALFNPKLNPGLTDLEKRAKDRLLQSVEPSLKAISASLVDSEMRKSKRVREVLKTAEKLVQFIRTADDVPVASLNELKDQLGQLTKNNESATVSKVAAKLSDDIESVVMARQTIAVETAPPDEGGQAEGDAMGSTKQTKKTKKDKKKKKKGKR